MKCLTRTIGLFLAFCGCVGHGQPSNSAAVTPPKDKQAFHIYLLMGQSNMAGRGALTNAQPDNPRIFSLDTNGQWAVARDPLHQKDGRIEPGVGPGMSFAREMLKADPSVTIGLVPCAVGGTPLRRWVKGGDLYERAVSRAKVAAQNGTISGVLWHQGESDDNKKENAETYEARLTQMIKDLRQDLGQPDLPVVVGQLGGFLEPEKHPFADTVRAAIKQMPAALPGVAYADSTGLVDKGDNLHFNAGSQNIFGARYAQAMRKLEGVPEKNPLPTAPTVEIWPVDKMPGHGAKEPEAERPSKDEFHRITNISHPALMLFPAPKKDTPAPTMIVCPGGGYNYVVVDKEGSEIAAWLNTNGFNALVLKYRTPNNRAGALQDAQRALSLARANAAKWNIDPKRLGIIGFSAGGNIAAKASTQFGERTYTNVDEVDQQSCRPDFAVLVYPAYLDDRNGHISPDLNLKASIPPTLILHNEDDLTFVPGSKLYDAALTEAKVPHEFKLYATGGHGYGLRCTKDARVWPDDALQWLQKNGIK